MLHGAEEEAGELRASPFTFRSRRIRLDRDDELFEDGDIHRHLYLQDAITSVAEEVQRAKISVFCCHIAGCSQLFDTLENYEHHYNTFHRNVCSSCKRSFPSSHLLDIHILEWHDSLFQILAAKQNMYQCLVESCMEKFKSYGDRRKHLVNVHSYPPDFRFDKQKITKRAHKKKNKNPHDMDVKTAKHEKKHSDVCGSISGEPMEQGSVEMTEAESEPMSRVEQPAATTTQGGSRFSYRVPATICFGHGSVRGFKNPRKKRRFVYNNKLWN
uniref:Zinc finger protein 511 n=1 Tax=Callorhinchus milii TaxID=7868 RepID=V9L9W6_CALMI